MPELKCKMFKESEKSAVSDNLLINVLTFIFVFCIIIIAEMIIPWLIAKDAINAAIDEVSVIDSAGGKLSFDEIRSAAMSVGMKPSVLFPTLLTTAFGTIISIINCRFAEARPMASMGVVKHKAGLHYLMGAGVGLVLMSLIALVPSLFGVCSISLCSNIDFGIIGLLFIGFLVQGMSEEFIFRGYLMNSLAGRHHPYAAVGISAAAFSLAHVLNPGFGVLVFINLAMFGVFASLYMILFDDIWGVCAIHSVWNFLQGCFYGISVSGSGDTESVFRTVPVSSSKLLTGGDFGIEGSIFTTAVLGAGIALLLYLINKKKEKQK